MTKKKKIIILAGMVMLLVATAVLNIWLLGDNSGGDQDTVDTASFFTSYRMERDTTRAQEILYLDSIINNTGEEFATAKTTAMDQKLKLVSVMELELLLESLIKSKGFDDAVVSIGVNSDNINVIVMCEELTLSDTIIIYNLIKDEMGSADLVKIFNI